MFKMDKVEEEKLSRIDDKHLSKPSNILVTAVNSDVEKKRSNPTQNSPTIKPSGVRWNCLCSPTTHEGSFRCRFHRGHVMTRGGSVGSNLSELATKPRTIIDLV
ncbi:hypothetical protein K2173_010548 [Erythroxylum novogranatense]|uniref:Uncharacterized protein n=1 Tax=Erythroxylum novogranatense TaxID=1862640 RepID=A0AAV8TE40_9ROSI|nr:hypothetical protein K2173_010548 [Erythroxylum novogranatense]